MIWAIIRLGGLQLPMMCPLLGIMVCILTGMDLGLIRDINLVVFQYDALEIKFFNLEKNAR
ncbi:hypothetical protein JW865_05135 [Candidatus Bathyarchaeota archaeon]|nr:hypothetical protein [Candidatus Bathyarchaeota archaeon]